MAKVFAKAYLAGLVCMVVLLSGCVTITRPYHYVDDRPRLVGLCEVVDSNFIIKYVWLVREEEDEFPKMGCLMIDKITWKEDME